MAGRETLQMYRNEDFQETWMIRDTDVVTETYPDGTPVDLTGYTFAGAIRPNAGSSTLVLSIPSDAVSSAATGIYIESPATMGQFTITVRESALDTGYATAALGNSQGQTVMAYDIRMTAPDGTKTIIAAGDFIYDAGVI